MPTSAEYMREQLRAQAEVAGELAAAPSAAGAPTMPQPTVLDDTDPDYDEGPLEGELVD